MRTRIVGCIATLLAASVLPAVLLAGTPAQNSEAAKAKPAPPALSHNLAGTWNFFTKIPPQQGVYGTPSREAPPMTPWAQARFDAAKPGYGPRAVASGNDPILRCNPSGIPRVLLYPNPFEIVQTPDRVFMFFEREHLWRQIWIDGRAHPKDLEPTWMGDSVGHWEGDTFVVDTIGLNDKSWLDLWGHPHSEALHLVERYRRVDQGTMTMQLTVEDPTAYTATWVSDTKIFKLLPKNKSAMDELFCIPDEQESFIKQFVEPTAGAPAK